MLKCEIKTENSRERQWVKQQHLNSLGPCRGLIFTLMMIHTGIAVAATRLQPIIV